MINNDWKTRHVRTPSWSSADGFSRGGLTLRYKLENKVLSYKYSICNPKDNYCRKLGVAFADATQVYTIGDVVEGNETPATIVTLILLDIVRKGVDVLSKQTLQLIYSFILRSMRRELDKLFNNKTGLYEC